MLMRRFRHPPFTFQLPRKWCITPMRGSSGNRPSSPAGCAPQCTLGRIRTTHGSSPCATGYTHQGTHMPGSTHGVAELEGRC